MALTGNYIKYIRTPHETETQVVSTTDPEGVVTEQTVPVIVETTEDIENVYAIITNYMLNALLKDAFGKTLYGFQWRIYESAEARQNDPDDFILDGQVLGLYFDIQSDDNIRIKAYEILKAQEGFTNLING
tara:strand:+ start:8124 stop:8516 length:393 start_codon:yes stop_codon:yes gene_type:complete